MRSRATSRRRRRTGRCAPSTSTRACRTTRSRGDRELRDALTDASFRWLTRRDVAEFLTARIADRAPSVVVFATAAVSGCARRGEGLRASLVRRYLDAGGKIVWLAEVPFLFTFDPATNQMVPAEAGGPGADEGALRRRARTTSARASAGRRSTEAGRRWGISGGVVARPGASRLGPAGSRGARARRARPRRRLGEAFRRTRGNGPRLLLGPRAADPGSADRPGAGGVRAALRGALR